MKNIEVIVINRYNHNKINEVYTFNHKDERVKRLKNIPECTLIGDNDEKTSFIYKDNKMKGILLYRGLIKQYMTEDWINTFKN